MGEAHSPSLRSLRSLCISLFPIGIFRTEPHGSCTHLYRSYHDGCQGRKAKPLQPRRFLQRCVPGMGVSAKATSSCQDWSPAQQEAQRAREPERIHSHRCPRKARGRTKKLFTTFKVVSHRIPRATKSKPSINRRLSVTERSNRLVTSPVCILCTAYNK